MKNHNITIESFIPKSKSKVKLENNEFHMPADTNNIGKERYYVSIPEKYKLPFRIDMTAKVSYLTDPPSQLTFNIGRGNINFNGGYTTCADILSGEPVPLSSVYYNDIPSQEYVNISIMYGSKAMWVAVNDKYCFSANETQYIKSLQENSLPEKFMNGFDISICLGSKSKLAIKSFQVTEYENDEPAVSDEIENPPVLTPFEWYVKGLSPEVQSEMNETDRFLLNDMKSVLKFKRTIDKYGHLLYKSSCGFEYKVYENGALQYHETSWDYIKKPDYMDMVLNRLAETSPEFADRMFSKLWDCPSPHCKRISNNEHNGKTKIACRSTIVFQWLPSEFEEMRRVTAMVCEVVKEFGKKK